jgi:hypothetical protein
LRFKKSGRGAGPMPAGLSNRTIAKLSALHTVAASPCERADHSRDHSASLEEGADTMA